MKVYAEGTIRRFHLPALCRRVDSARVVPFRIAHTRFRFVSLLTRVRVLYTLGTHSVIFLIADIPPPRILIYTENSSLVAEPHMAMTALSF